MRWILRPILLLCILALLAAFGVIAFKKQWDTSQSYTLSKPIKRGNIIESVYGIGTVKANRKFELTSGITTTIKKLYVKEGDYINRGDKLVELQDATFIAPFSGTITWLPFKEGEAIFAQSNILDLVDLNDRYLVVSLEQRGALKVRPQQKAKINFDGMREKTFEGLVQSVYSSGNDFLVRIQVKNLPPQVLPGMTGDVAIGIKEKQNVLLVPTVAIENNHVIIYGKNSSKPVPLTIGIVDAHMAEVVSGDISEHDILIIRDKLKP
ncbi:MAG TPA: efflux RND transporter periplasmic adaptor subunit [Gammaproteobacteria bacterium]|nr:efflux RND transporter periplasmic adaptor subunit [Gammaproteobacteria bacterium]